MKASRNAAHATSRVGLWQLLDRLLPNDTPEAARDTIRFEHDVRLGHSPTDLVKCATSENGITTVRASVLGLLGTDPLLPAAVTESALYAEDDGATLALFNVFHGRMMAVVHSAWQQFGPHGATQQALRSFVGEDFEETVPLFGAGLSDVVRCTPEYLDPAALRVLLARMFPELDARVSIGEADYLPLDDAERPKLGVSGHHLGQEMAYGMGAWDPVGTARITTRELADVTELLPGGAAYSRLRAFVLEWLPRCSIVELDVPMRTEHTTWGNLSGGGRGSILGFDMPLAGHKPARVRLRVPLVTDRGRVGVRYLPDE